MEPTISAVGALLGLLAAVVLILKKVPPTYAMIFGAVIGGIVGGAGLVGTVQHMLDGARSIVPAILRIVTAGVLAGMLIETGAAARIAETILATMGKKLCLVAVMLATWALAAVGVFGDVAALTVAPIAIQMAMRAGIRKWGVVMALIGGVKAGNAMSPNPNSIAAAEAFGVPLTSVMLVGIVTAAAGLLATGFLSRFLAHKGAAFGEADAGHASSDALPPLWASLTGPAASILLLVLRPLFGIVIDPLIALPLGGLAGMIAMGKLKCFERYLATGLEKMSGVAMLILGTGVLAGIISAATLKDWIIVGIESIGLPGFMLAPISGILMGAATASSVGGATLAGQIFGSVIVAAGVAPLAGAAMTHAGSFVLDGLPHGSFFHVTAGAVNMEIRERLKLMGYEVLNGLAMVAAATVAYGVFHLAG